MANLQHRPDRSKPWRVRWRDAQGHGRSRSFTRKSDALRYLHELDVRLDRGQHPTRDAGRAAFGNLAETWLTGKMNAGRKPSTIEGYRSVLDSLVLPTLAGEPVGAITYPMLTSWAATLEHLSGSRRRHAIGVVAGVLDLAIRVGELETNPARLLDLPSAAPRRRHRYLDHRELHALADATGNYRTLTLLLGYSGLRWGEAVALRGIDVNPARGLLHVDRAQSEVRGRLAYVPPKTHQRRDVPIPDLVLELLPDVGPELLFTAPNRGPLRHRNFVRDVWTRATEVSGCTGLRIHELRHTAASLARAAGADAFLVARMLGHGDASITARVYADLFDVELEVMRRRMDAAATAALGPLRAPTDGATGVFRGTERDVG